MPAVAKKSAKLVKSKPKETTTKPKKQTLKKTQKTAEINAAKKLAKLKSTRAVSDKVCQLRNKLILICDDINVLVI